MLITVNLANAQGRMALEYRTAASKRQSDVEDSLPPERKGPAASMWDSFLCLDIDNITEDSPNCPRGHKLLTRFTWFSLVGLLAGPPWYLYAYGLMVFLILMVCAKLWIKPKKPVCFRCPIKMCAIGLGIPIALNIGFALGIL